jgi:hypothetical protein
VLVYGSKAPQSQKRSGKMRIKISEAERTDGKMKSETVDLAHRLLREVGAVIVENAIPPEILAEVSKAYFHEIRDGKKFRQPTDMPFFHHQIVANPFVLQVLEAAMGKKLAFALYWIHAIRPGDGVEQRDDDIHRDGGHSFAELPFALPVTGVYMDIPLVDFTEENGATKIWPGTHLVTDQPQMDVRYLSQRSKDFSSVQMTMPLGSLFLRDMRLWHAAMPNKSDTVRPMLDMLYVRVFQHLHERYPVSQEFKQEWPAAARKLLKTA